MNGCGRIYNDSRGAQAQMSPRTFTVCSLAVMLSRIAVTGGAVIYVDGNSPGGDGSSWATGFKYLQDALAVAHVNDEIRVAQGTYVPDRSRVNPGGSGDREATFRLKNGVAIKGGFAGDGEPDPDARDIVNNATILSGDLVGDDGLDFANNGENSYHVLAGSDTDETVVLDGFTVIGGNATGSSIFGGGLCNKMGDLTLICCTLSGNSAANGGGIYNDIGNLRLTDCIFSENRTTVNAGGGIYNDRGNMTVSNCLFKENVADSWGGGIYNDIGNVTLADCTFNNNNCNFDGGGVFNARGDIMLTDCRFNGNSAQNGGGVGSDYGSLSLINCVLCGNSARSWGGGMFNSHFGAVAINCIFNGNSADDGGGIGTLWLHLGDLMLVNCTLSGNSATDYGGAVFNSGYMNYESGMMLSKCILWGNSASEGPEIAMKNSGTVSIAYSCLQGGQLDVYVPEATLVWDDANNIDVDPCFVDIDNGDYHLKSIAGRWNPNSESWVTDDVNSPCIDAGDPNSDWTAELWPHGRRINMGAFGGTPQASMSESLLGNEADLDNNGCVNFRDFAGLAGWWLVAGALRAEDLNRDAIVDFFDVVKFIEEWLWEEI